MTYYLVGIILSWKHNNQFRKRRNETMKTSSDLQKLLRTIDRRSYPAYKDTKGSYAFGSYMLSIDHVQGDPFAAPSKISIHVDGKTAGFPEGCYKEKERRIAMQDYLLRLFGKEAERYNFKAKGSGKSGLLSVSRCGQEILERTACAIEPDGGKVILRMEIGFPAHGRTICSSELEKILYDFLPRCVQSVLFYKALDKKEVEGILFLADDRKYIRDSLADMGLVAFVANGAVLPRESGISDRPMKTSVPFASPKSLEITLQLPHKGEIKGMGIKNGITLIVGGGYHGKSTLLKALEMGVYDHIEGDGREYVITRADAVKIRAEDGRSVKGDDISLFVNNLPNGRNTKSFYTEDASGSTSQAANVVEAMESGSSLLLIDEDTCATNFMVRDQLMQQVVHRDKEPITPFIERVQYLYREKGISCIIVAGSSGSYFKVSDCIVQMDNYKPIEITEKAKEAAKAFEDSCVPKEIPPVTEFGRVPGPAKGSLDDRVKIKGMGKEAVSINKETIRLHYVEQIADAEQTIALGYLLAYAEKNLFNGRDNLQQIVDRLARHLEEKGFAGLLTGNYLPAGLAVPRKQEIFACMNRYRSMRL